MATEYTTHKTQPVRALRAAGASFRQRARILLIRGGVTQPGDPGRYRLDPKGRATPGLSVLPVVAEVHHLSANPNQKA